MTSTNMEKTLVHKIIRSGFIVWRSSSLAQGHNPMLYSRILLLEPMTPTVVHPSCVMIHSLVGACDVILAFTGSSLAIG
jgi:hypothetical protein